MFSHVQQHGIVVNRVVTQINQPITAKDTSTCIVETRQYAQTKTWTEAAEVEVTAVVGVYEWPRVYRTSLSEIPTELSCESCRRETVIDEIQ